jgi:hypothetical protein
LFVDYAYTLFRAAAALINFESEIPSLTQFVYQFYHNWDQKYDINFNQLFNNINNQTNNQQQQQGKLLLPAIDSFRVLAESSAVISAVLNHFANNQNLQQLTFALIPQLINSIAKPPPAPSTQLAQSKGQFNEPRYRQVLADYW